MSLKGKVVLVTGSTKGIGKAVIERVAADGASVVINYSSDGAPADEMVNKIGSDRALAIKADVSSIPDIEKLIQATVDKFGKIDCVMANAACAPMNDLESTTEEAFDKSFMLNVKGPYFLVQVCNHPMNDNVQLTIHRKLYLTCHATGALFSSQPASCTTLMSCPATSSTQPPRDPSSR